MHRFCRFILLLALAFVGSACAKMKERSRASALEGDVASASDEGNPPPGSDGNASPPPPPLRSDDPNTPPQAQGQTVPTAPPPSPPTNTEIAAFESSREQEFALPDKYRDLLERIKFLLQYYRSLYIDLTNVESEDLADSGIIDCATGGPLKVWRKRHGWHLIGPVAETFYFCHLIFKNDILEPSISDQCSSALIAIANHTIEAANARDFGGVKVRDIATGELVDPLGWNPFKGRWDAWNNDTCSSENSSSSWVVGWSLNTLALAHRISQDAKFIAAYWRGISYFHPRAPTNPYFQPGYHRYAEVMAALSANAPFIVTPFYTVGGNRVINANFGNFPWSIHYHYKGTEDPVFNTLNINAALAQALFVGGLTDSQRVLPVAKPDGSFVDMSYKEVGWRVAYSIYDNLAGGNTTYVDRDDVYYRSENLGIFEEHLIATTTHMARIAGILKNVYIQDALKKTVDQVRRLPNHGGLEEQEATRFYCALRTLSPSLMTLCRESYQMLRPTGSTTTDRRSWLWGMHSALFQASR